jgi:4-hydroxy-tetrahydrodipicolinate reductase
MNIVLIGYGKMGKEIHQIAIQRGHDVVKIIDQDNKKELYYLGNKGTQVDVAIEFSQPSEARINITNCIKMGIPVVSGTTGWNNDLEDIKSLSHKLNASFLHASNFSLGMNLVFAVNQFLAKMMNNTDAYTVQISETHHTQKLDKPSGTAVTLADQIIQNIDRLQNWELDSKETGVLGIEAIRKEDTPGIHSINYQSEFDEIKIFHSAKNRKGFALGAVIAAEFLNGKSGVYEMKDVMNSLMGTTTPA